VKTPVRVIPWSRFLQKLLLLTNELAAVDISTQPAVHDYEKSKLLRRQGVRKLQVFEDSKQTLALRQASEESACFLLSFFCHD